jgi:hypothetical protein
VNEVIKSLADLLGEMEEAWPDNTDEHKIGIEICGPDQVVHNIERVGLRLGDDGRDTIVFYFKEEKQQDIFLETIAKPIAEEFNAKFGVKKDAPESADSSGARARSELAGTEEGAEGTDDSSQADVPESVPATGRTKRARARASRNRSTELLDSSE